MATPSQSLFHVEVNESVTPTSRLATVLCHGRLVSATADQLKTAVRPLIAAGSRIVIDFEDVQWMDSSGLGTIVGLKVSTLNKGGSCSLELVKLSPRVRELLSLSNLLQLFSIKPQGSAFSYHLSAMHPGEQEDLP